MEEKIAEKAATNKAKIVDVDGKYFLEVGGARGQKVPLGPLVEGSMPKEMVGKSVDLVMSDAKPYIAGVKFPGGVEFKCYFILCYLPKDLFGRIDDRLVVPLVNEQVRTNVARKLRDEKVIKAEDYERIIHL